MLTKLDLVNGMLATLGEVPVDDLDDDHPFIASALNIIETVTTEVQTERWWFSHEHVRMEPDPRTGFIMRPNDLIEALTVNPSHIVIRGRKLYDTSKSDYKIGEAVDIHYLRRVPFEDLPTIAQLYVKDVATYEFQLSIDADRMKVQELTRKSLESRMRLKAEETRQRGVNLTDTLFSPNARLRIGGSRWQR